MIRSRFTAFLPFWERNAVIRSCRATFSLFLERNSVFLSRIATFQPPWKRNAVIRARFDYQASSRAGRMDQESAICPSVSKTGLTLIPSVMTRWMA